MYLLVLIDIIVLGIVFIASLGLYKLNNDNSISQNEFYELQEYVINKYIEKNRLDKLDSNKIYHIDYKTGEGLIFKEGTGGINLTENGLNLNNFNLGKSYSIKFDITSTEIKMKTNGMNLNSITITK